MKSSVLVIEHPLVRELQPYKNNSRRHSAKQIRQIATSIQRFGFNNPLLIDADNVLIAGHGRLEAAIQLGMEQVPVVRLGHLSPAERRAYRIADNRLAELASWDPELLRLEVQQILEADVDFEVTDLGFETAEIDILLGGTGSDETDPADNIIPKVEGPAVSRPGDLWLVGPHKLYCGDALASSSYDALLAGEKAQMVFTDPPYNVPIAGHVSGLGKASHREFAMASGEMTQGQFIRFLRTVLGHLARVSEDGSIHFVCMDWRHLFELMCAARRAYSEFKNLCVWTKSNGGMGSLYRSQHEMVAVFKSGTAPHINNVELGRHGRSRTNIWAYAGLNSFQADREVTLQLHPTVKPVSMVADAMLDCSRRGGLILDPFGGAGTAIIAAERIGRRAYLMEIDGLYVDAALRRIRAATGAQPICAATGRDFRSREDEALAAGAAGNAGDL